MTLAAGLANPVDDSQRAFRCLLDALARPGRAQHLDFKATSPGLSPAVGLALLTLCDETTPVWWQPGTACGALSEWLRFHTGAPACADPQRAAFAAIDRPDAMPALSCFAPGSLQAPEQSTTILLAASKIDAGPAVEWSGPGIETTLRVAIDGLVDDFWTQWNSNHASFPQGVDVLFCCDDRVIGMPRTTRVRRLQRA